MSMTKPIAEQVRYTPSGTGAVETTVQAKLRESVSVKDFGAVGDGVTDDTAELQAAINYAKSAGVRLYAPSGAYLTGQLVLTGGTAGWELIGDGPTATRFIHKDGNGTLMLGNASSAGYTLCGFSVDCQFLTYAHPSASHGISISDTSFVTVQDVYVTDYKNSAIIIGATAPNVHKHAHIIDCVCDGMDVANNGFLIGGLDYSSIRDSVAMNVLGSLPGYGIQLKNDTKYSWITDCQAYRCVAGIAFGSDTLTTSVSFSTVKGCSAVNCSSGMLMGYATYNNIEGLFINMNSTGESAIDVSTNCVGNSIDGAVIRNIAALKFAVRFRSGATDNAVDIRHASNFNTTGKVAQYDSGSLRNTVVLTRADTPTIPATGVSGFYTIGATAGTNSFTYKPYPTTENLTIASGVITYQNQATEFIRVETEGAAAADDLDTISGFQQEGKTITLRQGSNVRDVTFKHGTGNMRLNGGVDFVFTSTRQTLTLCWNGTEWVELARGTGV